MKAVTRHRDTPAGLLIALLFVLAAPGHARPRDNVQDSLPAARPAYDTIAGDLPPVLSAKARPYLVVADIYVPRGKTVTLEAGTILLFKNFTSLHVQGRLKATGTSDAPVVFTSENDSAYNRHASSPAAPFDWNGIYLHEDAIGSQLSHCRICYTVEGIVAMTKFFQLSPCVFRHNGRASLTIGGEVQEVGDKPYEYSLSLTDPELEGVPIDILRDPRQVKRNAVRYTGLATFIGGCNLVALFAARMRVSLDRHKQLSSEAPRNLADHSEDEWEDSRKEKNRHLAGLLAGMSLLVGGGLCFGVSFSF